MFGQKYQESMTAFHDTLKKKIKNTQILIAVLCGVEGAVIMLISPLAFSYSTGGMFVWMNSLLKIVMTVVFMCNYNTLVWGILGIVFSLLEMATAYSISVYFFYTECEWKNYLSSWHTKRDAKDCLIVMSILFTVIFAFVATRIPLVLRLNNFAKQIIKSPIQPNYQLSLLPPNAMNQYVSSLVRY